MNDTISISTARANLPQIIEDAARFLRRFTITVNGQPKAVVMSQEEIDSIEETAEILAIPGAREAIAEGEKQLKMGQGIPLRDFLKKNNISV